MEMHKYSAVTEAMGTFHTGSGLVILHTETVLPRRRSDKALPLYLQWPSCAVGGAGQTFHSFSNVWD